MTVRVISVGNGSIYLIVKIPYHSQPILFQVRIRFHIIHCIFFRLTSFLFWLFYSDSQDVFQSHGLITLTLHSFWFLSCCYIESTWV